MRSAVGLAAKVGDLVVLGGESGQRLALDVDEFENGLVTSGEALLEGVDLVLHPGDLGVAGVGDVAGHV